MASYPGNAKIRGGNTQYGFAAEATPNDGITTGDALAWFQPLSDGLKPVIEKVELDDMGLTDDGLSSVRYVAKEHVEGDLDFIFDVDNCGMLLRAAWGAVATSGSGPYTHTYTLDIDNPATLGAARVSEDTAGTTYEDEYGQLLVSKYVLEASPGGQVKQTLSLVGNIDTLGTSAATQTRATPAPTKLLTLLSKHSAAMSWNSNTYELTAFQFVLERTGIGSDVQYVSQVGIAETYIGGNTKAYVEVEMLMSDYHLMTAARGDTQSDASIVFTVGSDTVTLTLENAEVASYDEDSSSMGPKTVKCRFEATGGGSFGAKMVVVNSQANAVVTHNTAA